MSNIIIYHNPRCSKSRQTLALLTERDINPEIVLYLDNAPSQKELTDILTKLGMSARELIRKGEDQYKELNLNNTELSEEQLINAMANHPKLIERPIVVNADKAIIGRPPENVLEIV